MSRVREPPQSARRPRAPAAQRAPEGRGRSRSAEVRRLQRRAGNAAVGRALRRRALQRDVGFEFEMLAGDVNVLRSGWTQYYAPPKHTHVLDGLDYHVETDYAPGGTAALEFVTTHFPETVAGLTRLHRVLDHIDGIVQELRARQAAGLPPGQRHHRLDGNFATHGTVMPHIYFDIHTPTLAVRPQVTLGLNLVALNRMFQSAATRAGGGASNLVRDTAAVDRFGRLSAGPSPPNPNLAAIWRAAGRAVQRTYGRPQRRVGRGRAGRPVAPAGSDAAQGLQALVTQAMQIIVGGHDPAGIGQSPKTVLQLVLHRTDFKHMFDTLPDHLKRAIRAQPATFVNMVMAAVSTITVVAPGSPVIDVNLFTHPSMIGDPHYNTPSPFRQVTCAAWLTSFVQGAGVDLMSSGNYPRRTEYGGLRYNATDVTANRLLDSMGGQHALLDPGRRPVFEIRNSKPIMAGLIPAYALDYFKYVRHLHSPRARRESALLTGSPVADAADMIGFSPNRPNVIRAMQRGSRDTFNR